MFSATNTAHYHPNVVDKITDMFWKIRSAFSIDVTRTHTVLKTSVKCHRLHFEWLNLSRASGGYFDVS